MRNLNFMAIGAKIKERRIHQKITQEYIANILEVNPSHISNIECGRANPSLTALVQIANILECSVDYFLSGEYTYDKNSQTSNNLDKKITHELLLCDNETKEKILKIIQIIMP